MLDADPSSSGLEKRITQYRRVMSAKNSVLCAKLFCVFCRGKMGEIEFPHLGKDSKDRGRWQ